MQCVQGLGNGVYFSLKLSLKTASFTGLEHLQKQRERESVYPWIFKLSREREAVLQNGHDLELVT